MFSKKTHNSLTMIHDPEEFKNNPVVTVAKGVARLMKLIWVESKKTLQAEPLILGGIIAITRAFDFAERGLGIPFDSNQVARATKIFLEITFETIGVKPEQLAQAIAQGHKEIQEYQKHQAFLDGKIQALRPNRVK
jgi:hypothetical protein